MNTKERERRRERFFASSPMFLNHLDASFISSHCFYVLCVISSPSPPMHPVFTCSLWLETAVQAKVASLFGGHQRGSSFLLWSTMTDPKGLKSIPTFMMSKSFVRVSGSFYGVRAKEIHPQVLLSTSEKSDLYTEKGYCFKWAHVHPHRHITKYANTHSQVTLWGVIPTGRRLFVPGNFLCWELWQAAWLHEGTSLE